MSSINSVVLVGRLTRDPELRFTPSGAEVCQMRLAVDRAGQKEGDEIKAGFFDVSVWGRAANACAQYLVKGSQCGVSGSLRFREWEANDGTKRQAVEVNAREVQFLSSKADRVDGQGSGPAPQTTADFDAGAADDDIPF